MFAAMSDASPNHGHDAARRIDTFARPPARRARRRADVCRDDNPFLKERPMNLLKLTVSAGLVALLSLTACADDEEGSSGGGSGESTGAGETTSQTTGSSQTASCCINGEFFDCGSDTDAADACFNDGDTSGCSADPGRDLDCE